MDEVASYVDVCRQLEKIEIQLIKQLALALRKCSPDNQELGKQVKLLKTKLKCFEQSNDEEVKEQAKDLVVAEKDFAELKTVDGILLVLNLEKCIYVSGCLTSKQTQTKAMLGKQWDEIFCGESLNILKAYAEKCVPGEEENPTFLRIVKLVSTELGSDSGKNMSCFGISTTTDKLPEISASSSEKHEKVVLCLISPLHPNNQNCSVSMAMKPPPNQTVNTRIKIPQPHRFSTRQDLTGKITAINHNLPQWTAQMKRSVTTDERDLVERCLATLNEPRKNGSSLFQIHHKQVLQNGQATSITYKFHLGDCSTATAQTKSKLMGSLGQQGEPPFILSVHSIYRDGKLQGLEAEGISPAIRSILSGPFLPGSSTNCSTTGITPAFAQTKTSMTSSEIRPSSNWCLSTTGYMRPQNSAEVARELLAKTGAQGNAEEIVNGILSPPPHLDGHLVHSVGSSKPQSETSATNLNYGQEIMCDNVLPPDNLATFPGPPCVELSCLKKEDQTLPSSTSLPTLFVNGTSSAQQAPSSDEKLTVTSPHSDITSPSHSRVRSASMHSAPPSVNLPKRSISTPIQEEQAKKSPRHKTTSITKSSKLLTQLLSNTTKVPEAQLLGTSVDVSSSLLTSSVPSSSTDTLTSLIEQFSPQQATTRDFPISANPPASFDSNFFNSPSFTSFTSTRPSVTTNVSKEELEELCEILTGFNEDDNVFGSNSSNPPALSHPPLPNGEVVQQFNGMQNTDMNNNNLMPASNNFQQFQPSFSNDFNQDGQANAMFTPKPDMMMSQIASQQNPMSPMYQGAAMASVPTGFEPCPNRVVGNTGIVNPQIPPPLQSPAPRYPTFNPHESWEGKEPLVDLGRFPLPQGVNPRMTIPVPNNMDPCVNRMSGMQSGNPPLQNSSMTYRTNNHMTRALRHNGATMNDVTGQSGVMMLNSPGSGGAFPNPRNTDVRQMGGNRHNMQPNVGNSMQSNPSALRRQLQLRLNHPNVNGASFDSDVINNGMMKQGNPPVYPRSDLQKRNEMFIAPNRIAEQKQAPIQRAMAPSSVHSMRNPMQLNSQRFMSVPNGQGQVVGQQQFPRMSNFTNPQPPAYSPQGGVMSGGEIYQQQYSNPPIQNYFNPSFKQGATMTSPDTQQFNGLSPPLTSQSPKAKKPRVKKIRKNSSSKSKDAKRKRSSDEISWGDVAPPSGGILSPQYCHPVDDNPPLDAKKSRKKVSRRPVMQMTFGDMQSARLQPNTDTSSVGVTSQIVSSRPQTLNLNVLLEQYKQKKDFPMQGNDPPVYNSHNNAMTSPEGIWAKPIDDVTSSLGGSSLLPNNTPLFQTTNHCDVTINSNVNNNKPSIKCRYTASLASAPILSPSPDVSSAPVMTSSSPLKRNNERKPSLLETLLLKKDAD